MNRRLGLVLLLALVGCSTEPGPERERDSTIPPASPDASVVTTADPSEVLDVAEVSMANVADVTYAGTTEIALESGKHRFKTQWVLAPGGRCQVTNRSRRLGVITTRQLGRASFDKYDRRAVVRVLKLPGYYAEDYAGKWLVSRSPLLGAEACSPSRLVPGPAYRSSFVAGEVTRIGDLEVRRFDGRNQYGPVSLWISTEDVQVLRWRGAARGETRDLWLKGIDKGRRLSRPPRGQVVELG